jgi:hypothetical protein
MSYRRDCTRFPPPNYSHYPPYHHEPITALITTTIAIAIFSISFLFFPFSFHEDLFFVI